MSRCKARVWANGDTEDCGKDTDHTSGVCASCRAFKIPLLELLIQAKREELNKLEDELRSYQ